MSCLIIKELLKYLGEEGGNLSDVDLEAILKHAQTCSDCREIIEKGENLSEKLGLRFFDLVSARQDWELFLEQGPEKFIGDLKNLPVEFTMSQEEMGKRLAEENPELGNKFFFDLHKKIMKRIVEARKSRESGN